MSKEQLQRALWGDLDSGIDDPSKRPLLAHYTSLASFELIVKSQELWLSHPFYMNDREELRWGIEQGAAGFRSHAALREACGGNAAYGRLVEIFDELLFDFVQNHAIDTYVLCLSEHDANDNDGRLSMWRGYGANGAGVGVVLDLTTLNRDDDSPLILSKVDYRSPEHRMSWIGEKLDAVACFIASSGKTDGELRYAALEMFERLCIAALFSKHRGFDEEREWRVVYLKRRDLQRRFQGMYGYAVGPTGVQPKLKLKLARDSGVIHDGRGLSDLVDRIILGPTQSGRLATEGVCRMLEELEQPHLVVKVRQSSIPFLP